MRSPTECRLPQCGSRVVVLVLRDVKVTSTAVKWLQGYAKEVRAGGGELMLAYVNPAVVDGMRRNGALQYFGEDNVFRATTRVLEAENRAWDCAQQWLAAQKT